MQGRIVISIASRDRRAGFPQLSSSGKSSDPANRTALILAGGFSDPSAWVPGRLKSMFRGCGDFATALSFPKTALPRAASPMQTDGCKKNPPEPPQLVTDRNRCGRGSRSWPRLSCWGCIEQSERRGESSRETGSRPHLARLGGQTQTGNHIVSLGAPDSEHVRSRAEIDSVSVSNGRAFLGGIRRAAQRRSSPGSRCDGRRRLRFEKHSIGTQGPAEEYHLG